VHIFRAHERYGVPRINVYLLRTLYLLMVVFLGQDAWSYIVSYEGTWNPEAAAAWSVWAAFSVLAGIGLFHPLRMLPIVLLEILYKSIWLVVVGFPMLSAGTLDGRAEEMMFSFGLVVLPIVATPWGYVYRTFLRRDRADGRERAPQVEPSYDAAS
jgi:hypothetical protein